MPKFRVRRYAEQVQYIEVEAETQDDAYDLAVEAEYHQWSEWDNCDSPGEIESDHIEEIEEEEEEK